MPHFTDNALCPCGSEKNMAQCCGPYLSGQQSAPDARALMRSRYSAFVTHNADHLIRTWYPPERAQLVRDDLETGFTQTQWLSLNIIDFQTGPVPDEAFVEFCACFIDKKSEDKQLIHERSRFRLIDNQWFYLDGVTPQTGRNDPCPCGSGKKYKKCCA
ncbi:YchJ family protein [Morganella psychrotolerans]|uniref:YchJ family protein n=1 Tax=Morganella psychrotolerans TaxID=368603 RepID=A0A5M9RAP5_9GAMM|nr:YchJ family protein [Morganella psychrotolerans]KAA8717369.1 YchJ family protein [Morganella psychrotolerans]